MKKLLLIASAMFVFAFAHAQDAPKAEQKQPTKEEKQKMKEKQEAEIAAAFKEIGLTDEQIQQVKTVMDETSKKNGELRKNETLTDDQKKEQMKANNDEKNQKIKDIMGEEKYRQYNQIRKKQKEQSADMNAPKPAGN
jgi:Spy/CpxP family protein refolding chaperone